MFPLSLQTKVRELRSQGRTYLEIREALGVDIPKSTLSDWCRTVTVPHHFVQKVKNLNKLSLAKAREIANDLRKQKRVTFFQALDAKNQDLLSLFDKDKHTRKITLAVLYLAEGSKTARGSLMFGNSDPLIIELFINLLRECYKVDESKFRCTLQGRADQDIDTLEKFWSKTTGIPLDQFYKARIDKRTIGQTSRKLDYKGVCRIDYFSSAIDLELKYIAQMLLKNKS